MNRQSAKIRGTQRKNLRKRTDANGMALMLCLLLITTLCLVGGAALSISGMNRKIVHNATKQAQAFYVAEAGRELALANLREAPLWRGDDEASPQGFDGSISIGGIQGGFSVSLSDCTSDDNGICNALLPAGHVLIACEGTYLDAVQTVFCLVRMTPAEGSASAFPQAAVISSGTVTGPLVTLDDLGGEDSLLLQTVATLPEANAAALKAMAGAAFSSLDDDAWDAALTGISSFWRDSPVDTLPHIFYVQGDLDISGDRQLYGVVFVEGSHVALADESGIHGVLYAPNATSVTIQNTGVSGRLIASGQMIAGSGGVEVTGNQVSVQLCPDYVDAFNTAAGDELDVEMVSGSWASR